MAAQVPRDFQDGDIVTLEDMNAILAVLRELNGDVAGDRQARGPRYVKTPTGGIPVGGSANCTVASRNPTSGAMTDGTATLKVFHHPGATVDVEELIYIVVDRVSGTWQPIVEAC
jgi:hypothetical protein